MARIVADIEIHSKHSRAVSPQMTPENIGRFAAIKGIDIVGTGDFTHPLWITELKAKLEPAEPGLFRLRSSAADPKKPVKFMLTGEVSCIYSEKGRLRKVHHLLFAPDFQVAEKINARLSTLGNLRSDGRPILGMNSRTLLRIVKDASPDAYLIPAHVWTPHFGIFGSKSGFDSLEECFGEETRHLIAIETGLSSDPAMNWRLSFLDRIAIISSSDAHSPPNIGREATLFDLMSLDYFALFDALKVRDPGRFIGTIEFFPEEGMYHFDGHRACGVSFSPKESKRHKNLCPKCGRPLTIGVMNRVEELADRPEGFTPPDPIPFTRLVGLEKIIADVFGVGRFSKKVEREYFRLIDTFGNELEILLNVPRPALEAKTLPEIAEGIIRVREGRVKIEPGYDGRYGKIKIFESNEPEVPAQSSLF